MRSVLKKIQFELLFSLFAVVFVVGTAYVEILQAVKWNPSTYRSDDVINLTSTEAKWDVRYGKDYLCGEVFCRDVSQETIVNYKRVLPNRSFGEETLVRDQILSYQIEVAIPDKMLDAPVGVHFLHLFSRRFEFFVNGTLVKEGDGIYADNLTIPSEALEAGKPVKLTFKIDTLGVAEPGFDLRANVLVGPLSLLGQINAEKKLKDKEFTLWLVVPRLVIAFLFAFGTMFFAYSRDYVFYVAYTIVTAVKVPVFFGMTSIAGIRTGLTHNNLYNLLDVGSSVLMFLFVYRFYRQNRAKVRNVFVGSGGVVVLVFFGLLLSVSSQQAAFFGLWLSHIYKGLSLVYCTFLSFSLYRYLRYTGKSPSRMYIVGTMTLCFGMSLLLLPIAVSLSDHYWMHILVFELLVSCLFASCVSTDMGKVRAERDLIRHKMGVHVDEGLVQELIGSREFIARNVSEAAILFIDIRGFTEMSETSTAQEVFDLLNVFHNEIIDCVYEHKGVIDKFMGDSLMAVWGVRHYDKESAMRASVAALSMSEKLASMNEQRKASGLKPINYGISVHVGSVVAGHIGNERRAEFSVIGSAVNIASRLEGLTGRLDRRILISQTVYDRIKKEAVVGDLGYHQIRGISTPFQVFSLVGVMTGRSEVTLVRDPRYSSETVKPWPHVIDEKVEPSATAVTAA